MKGEVVVRPAMTSGSETDEDAEVLMISSGGDDGQVQHSEIRSFFFSCVYSHVSLTWSQLQ